MTADTGNQWVVSFADVPAHLRDPARARVRIVPLPYAGTVTYGGGTGAGPGAIIQASQQLELWDEELGCEPCSAGIATEAPVHLTACGPEAVSRQIHDYVKTTHRRGRFDVFLGGEHTVSVGVVSALAESEGHFSVLQLDAHADLRDSYEGSAYSHACVMRRLAEIVPVFGLGIRSLSGEEARWVAGRGVIHQSPQEIERSSTWQKLLEEKLAESVYLTIDLDVFDPAWMPAVGTPEPGGLSWRQVLDIVRFVASRRRLVGADVVELAPIPGLIAPDFLAAKLVYKIIGYATCLA